MLQSLRARLGLILFAFALIVLTSVAATYWGLEAQRQDALVINLAGRQRMLVEQMARLALEMRDNPSARFTGSLRDSEQVFDQSLNALRDGGEAPYLPDSSVRLPETRSPEIRAALDELAHIWTGYRASLNALVDLEPGTPAFDESLSASGAQSTALLQEADRIVRLYQDEASGKISLLRFIQAGFLICALALLAAGAWLTRKSLLDPLQALRQATDRLGQNNLSTPIEVDAPQEIDSLAEAFDAMRINLLSAQSELVQMNASLEKRVAQRTRELEALYGVSREITSHLDLQTVLASITEKARSLLSADVASLCLLDDDYRWLDLQGISGASEAVVGVRATAEAGFAGQVLAGQKALACSSEKDAHGCKLLSPMFRASHLAAPLRIGERVIGAICVGSRRGAAFNGEDEETLAKLASTAAVALENARLYQQAERVAALEERGRIAAEIHDGLGQTLSYLGLMMDQAMEWVSEGQEALAIQRLQHARQQINLATREVRRSVNQLMDTATAPSDLCTTLEDSIRDLADQHNLQVEWHNGLVSTPACTRETIEQVSRVVGEALTNAARHARASRVLVSLCEQDAGYRVVVEDNGAGFIPSQVDTSGHFGLQIMQARAAHIHGELTVESAPGQGTSVTLEWQR
jgi:nitrate/nitrite-specific signal transduction histidine kinase